MKNAGPVPSETPTLDRWLHRAGYVLRPHLVLEDGAEEAIADHQEQGGNFIIVSTHFKRVGIGHVSRLAPLSPDVLQ